ncbi:MAG: alanine--glyoxylate aminotransferase family protein [Planctomycetota bacterium]
MPFVPSEVLLLGPGPSPASGAVRQAQAMPLLGHLDPEFLDLMDRVQEGLRALFGTGNALTLPIAGTGTAGMEVLVSNLVSEGDRVVVGVHGVFGQRLAEAVRRRGGNVVEVAVPFGEPLDEEAMERAIEGAPTALVALVHAETSTGVLQPLERIAAAAARAGSLLALDCVTSLGGVALSVDRLGIDAAFAGTQKCLSAPPGLSPVTLGPRALEKSACSMPRPPFYFDASLLRGYFGPNRAYHHTAPISMIYALAAALDEIEREGMPAREERHRRCARALRRGLAPLGLEPLVAEPLATPMLTSVKCPDGVDERLLRELLRRKHRIEVGGGLGPLSGRVFRVGLMGHGARIENVRRLVEALGDVLPGLGHEVDVESALAEVDR